MLEPRRIVNAVPKVKWVVFVFDSRSLELILVMDLAMLVRLPA